MTPSRRTATPTAVCASNDTRRWAQPRVNQALRSRSCPALFLRARRLHQPGSHSYEAKCTAAAARQMQAVSAAWTNAKKLPRHVHVNECEYPRKHARVHTYTYPFTHTHTHTHTQTHTQALEIPFQAAGSWGNAPTGCLFDYRGSFFNTHQTGGCSGACLTNDMTPICAVGGTSALPAGVEEHRARPRPAVQGERL